MVVRSKQAPVVMTFAGVIMNLKVNFTIIMTSLLTLLYTNLAVVAYPAFQPLQAFPAPSTLKKPKSFCVSTHLDEEPTISSELLLLFFPLPMAFLFLLN